MALLANIALVASIAAFAAGFMLTLLTGAARPVKILLAVLTGIFIIAFIAGLIFTRGLLIYLLFQLIALVILWYFMVIVGAVCGGGAYLLMHKKAPGKNLAAANLDDYLPASQFSMQEGLTEERAVARIKSGYYQGGRLKGAWYIHKSELTQNKNQQGAI